MPDILDYLRWRGDLGINLCPFNEVDGVVLARFSYLPIELAKQEISDGKNTVKDICRAILDSPLKESKILLADDGELMELLAKSNRFGGMRAFAYANRRESKTETQFCAVSLHMGNGSCYVSFRGTDSTLVGWKEDFNMCFACPVPAQLIAVRYLKKVAEITDSRLIVGGHSKGGNLAVYASMLCGSISDRIDVIYDYDGPGFASAIVESDEFKYISHKVKKFVPQSSVVGMLMESAEDYIIVHSSQPKMLLQHDVYSWEVKYNCFDELEEVTGESKFVDQMLTDWLSGVSKEEREVFVDTVYGILTETKARTVDDLTSDYFKNAITIINGYRGLDEGTRNALKSTLKILIGSMKKNAIKAIRKK